MGNLIPAAPIAAGLALVLVAKVTAAAEPGPREIPPEGFLGRQFVDSSGCVFLRDDSPGAPLWRARPGPDGRPICGQTPSPLPPEAAGRPSLQPSLDSAAVPGLAAPDPVPGARPRAQPEGRPQIAAGAGDLGAPQPDSAPPAMGAGIAGPDSDVLDPKSPQYQPAMAPRAAAARSARLPSASLAPQASSPGARKAPPDARFVQVGTFGVAANADAAMARLRALGLPVATAQVEIAGRAMKVVLAGPLSGPALAKAWRKARQAGFDDAFMR